MTQPITLGGDPGSGGSGVGSVSVVSPITRSGSAVNPVLGFLALALGMVNVTLPPYSVDSTGASDAGPGLQAAFNALAATGQVAWMPKGGGNYKVATPVTVPSGLIVWGAPDTVVTGALGIVSNPANAIFYANSVDSAFSTTLHLNNVVGSNQVNMVAAPANGSIVNIVSTANPLRSAQYVVQTSAAGGGGFVVTLDRPLLKQYAAADVVQGLASVPTNIQWFGNGMLVTGTADRFFELIAANNCLVQNVNLLAVTGNASTVLASYDVQALGSRWVGMTANGAGVAGQGILVESGESCTIEHCVSRGSTTCLGLWDCDVCGIEDGVGSGGSFGATLTADANTIGCWGCWITGGFYSGNSQYGVLVDDGSSECRVDTNASYNATYGLLLSGSGTMDGNHFAGVYTGNTSANVVVGVCTGTKATDVTIGATPGFGAILESEIEWKGLTNNGRCSSGTVLLQTGPYSAHFTGVQSAASSVAAIFTIGAGIRCSVSGAHIDTGNGVPGFVVGGAAAVLSVSDCDLANASIGIHVTSGGTARIGANVFFAGSVTTPLTVDSGGFCNRKQTSAGSVGGVAVAWPDLTATDEVLLLPTAAVFTGWVSSRTPGTGFTIKDAAAGTYEYFIP
jgi:hypothetical protein